MAFALITLLHVVVGELSPKSLAIARPERTIVAIARPMRAFYLATKPVVDLFNALGNLLLKPFGIPPASESGSVPHTERELLTLLRESDREGLIEGDERQLAENVLTFGDRRVREVMVPRAEAAFFTTQQTVQEAVDAAIGLGYTHFALCQASGLDAPIGMIHAKDLLRAVAKEADDGLAELKRPIAVFAESTLIDEVLREMRACRRHLALVIDEHGTTVGLVTLEDLLEEIVGEIEDEFDGEIEEMVRRGSDGWVVAGGAPVRLVQARLDIRVDDGQQSTIGGRVIERLGRLPKEAETVELGGRAARIERVDGPLIAELIFPNATEDADADETIG